jgi:hypothetical protein
MKHIDVHDLPEPVARAIQTTVEAVRQQLKQPGPAAPRPVKDLPRWEGTVLGRLTREEIYDDLP